MHVGALKRFSARQRLTTPISLLGTASVTLTAGQPVSEGRRCGQRPSCCHHPDTCTVPQARPRVPFAWPTSRREPAWCSDKSAPHSVSCGPKNDPRAKPFRRYSDQGWAPFSWNSRQMLRPAQKSHRTSCPRLPSAPIEYVRELPKTIAYLTGILRAN